MAKKTSTQEVTEAPEETNKSELIRKAVEAGHTKPLQGVAYIKEEFGLDIDPKYFSIVKGKHAKKDPSRPESPSQSPRQAGVASDSAGIVADIADVRRLLAAHGEEGLKELIKVLK